jgi:UMF1 family MFS transporter
MLRLTPPSRIGEFYGLYGMVGRFSAITGPLIWAGVTWLTINTFHLAPHVGQGIGVIVLLSMIVIGYVILRPVSDAPRDWSTARVSPAASPARS